MVGLGATAEMSIGVLIVGWVIALLVGAAILSFATKRLKFAKTDFKTALLVIFLAGMITKVISIIPYLEYISWSVSIVLTIVFIRTFYNESWGRSTKACFITLTISFIIYLIISSIIGGLTFFRLR